MNPTIPSRVHARSRADQRLHAMTVGAAVLGIAATGGFAYAAALTYSGTSTANADQGGALRAQPAQPGNGTSSSGQSDDQGSQGGVPNPFFAGQQAAPPTATRHHAHVSSGGS